MLPVGGLLWSSAPSLRVQQCGEELEKVSGVMAGGCPACFSFSMAFFLLLLCASVYLAVEQRVDLTSFCRPRGAVGVCCWVSWQGGSLSQACPLPWDSSQLLLRRLLC